MTLRTRIAVIAAAAVAAAVAVASVGVFLAAQRSLYGQVDQALEDVVRDLRMRPMRRVGPGLRPGRLGGAGAFVQLVGADGEVSGATRGGDRLPVTDAVTRVARGDAEAFFATTVVGGEPVRILTVPARGGFALQVARPLGEVATVLRTLRGQLVVVGLLGIALAALLGLVVARRAARPVVDLTEVVEDVAATQDLTRRLDVAGDDEIARLARSFNVMLGSLAEARSAQQQLIADASHELRTPLTSLRTNIEVLTHADRLSDPQRQALIRDVIGQLDEFSRLVIALVDLARGTQRPAAPAPVRLDELVTRVVDRVGSSKAAITVNAEPTMVSGEADRLERAVANLVDNALKYGAGAPIEVRVAGGMVEVRDHGPGIDPEDLPKVFDRFYRAPVARAAPGAGLGLAIVRQVAESHGGSASAENAEGGGARLRLSLPPLPNPNEEPLNSG